MMPFQYKEGLKYYSSSSLENEVRHGFFTRRGGFSPDPWDSLNMGGTVGDEIGRVTENRRLAFDALDLNTKSMFDVWQVHSTTVVLAVSPRNDQDHKKADIILTNQPHLTLMMRFADCTPIILFDPINRALGLIHSGWMGTVNKAAKVAVDAMKDNFGSKPEDIRAVIGPSIGPDHYEIGIDVAERVKETFGDHSSIVLKRDNGKIHFNLWEGNRILLEWAGVKEIEVTGICTACNLDDWYSHRAENGKTGRFGVLAALENLDD